MSVQLPESGGYVKLTATGDVSSKPCYLIGFYVNSTTGGTLVLRDGGSGGTAISGTITPAIGFHRYPAIVASATGLHATIANTLDVTFFTVTTSV